MRPPSELAATGSAGVSGGAGASASAEVPVLEARGLRVAYGRQPVLFDVDVRVEHGRVLAVLGANGAGKTTLLAALAGLMPIETGTIQLLGEDVAREPAERRVRRGLALIQGGTAIFLSLTVSENLQAGCFALECSEQEAAERREDALDLFPALRDRSGQRAGTLSGGERQMLSLAKGLLLGGELLCIDELSMGLAPVLVEELSGVVQRLRDAGRTMMIVEQSVSLALQLADEVMVLERGRVILEGSTEGLSGELTRLESALLGGGA